MAENNISIKVQADTTAARAEISNFGKVLEALGRTSAGSGMSSVGQAASKMVKAFDDAELAVAGLVDRFVEQAGAATSMAKGLSNVSVALKRIDAAQREASKSMTAYHAMMRNVAKDQEDFGTIGARSSREIKAEMDKLNAALSRLKKSSTATSQDVSRATQAVKKRMAELNAEMDGTAAKMDNVSKKSDVLRNGYQKLIGAWVAFQGLMAAGGIIAAVEEMDRLDARLKISEGSAKAAATAMDEIKRVATDTRAPVKDVADAYIRFSTAIQRAGGSQKQSIQFTELLSKALKVSGASAETTGRVMLQLGQAFDSGRLQGDEFRSVAENGGMVLNYLADALGVTRGQLREMGTAGELTADKLLKLIDAADQINKDFAQVPRTAGEAFVLVSNAFLDVAQKSSLLKALIQGLGEVLIFAAKNMGALISTAIIGGLTALIISAGGITAAFSAAATAVAGLRIALLTLATSNPWLLAFAAASTAIIWLWDDIKEAILYVMDLLGMKPETVAIDQTTEAVAELERQITGMQAKLGPALEAVKKQIDEQRKAATASVKAITQAYSEMAGQIDANASEQINVIRARYAEEKRLIAQTKGESDARYAAEAQALIASTKEQIEILKDSARQKNQLIDEEYTIASQATRVMYDNERDRAAALQALDNEVMQKKRTVLAQMLSDYRSHIDALNGEAERNFQAVKAIEEQKRGLSMSTQERIRSLQQAAMGEYAAYQDKLKQIDELNAKAREAILAGQSEQAVEYAKKAQDVAANIASGAKENGKEIVSQAQATQTAIAKISESERIAQGALDETMRKREQAGNMALEQAQTFSTSMRNLQTELDTVSTKLASGLQFTIQTNTAQVLEDVQKLEEFITQRDMMLTVQSNIDELKGKVDEMKESLETGTTSTHEIDDNAREVQRAIDNLKRDTSSTHTIYIRRVETNATGGLAGWSQRFRDGGQAFRRRIGKIVGAGSATSDSIPAMLSNGEFVIRASMVRKWGASFFEALNRGMMPPMPKYAMGGAVNVPLSIGGSSEALTVTFRAGDLEAPVRISDKTSRESMKAFARELQKIRLVQG